MSNSTSRVRDVFRAAQCELTLTDIKTTLPDLKASQISMSLCYFMRQRYMTRVQTTNDKSKGRKKVWLYTFHEARLPKPEPIAECPTVLTAPNPLP